MLKFIIFLLLTIINGNELCENTDGNCYDDDKTTYTITWLFHKFQFDIEIYDVIKSLDMQYVIGKQNIFEVHLSLNYLCNYTKDQMIDINNALSNFTWESFDIVVRGLGCNNDLHNNSKIYLHAMTDDDSTIKLTNISNKIENHLLSYGIDIYNPRKISGPKYHVTIATLLDTYPLDNLLEKYKNYTFYKFRICTLILTNPFRLIIAEDCFRFMI